MALTLLPLECGHNGVVVAVRHFQAFEVACTHRTTIQDMVDVKEHVVTVEGVDVTRVTLPVGIAHVVTHQGTIGK